MARLALLQCELEHRHQAPHLAMCLFAADLRAAGHEVVCALVHPSAVAEAAAWAQADLLVLDSIWPFGLVRRLQDQTGRPVLVGGHNALQHALRGTAEFSLHGASRSSLVAAVDAALGARPAESVAGLWFRDGAALDCGPAIALRRPADEILPFGPDLDWAYFGPPRAPDSNLRVPSVVAEMGCVWNAPAGKTEFYDGVVGRPPQIEATDRAQEQLAGLVGAEGGCTFCTFRYLPRAGHRIERRLELVVEQARELVRLGARGLSLQTEHPLPWLARGIEALAEAGLTARLDELHVRTIPWLLLRHEPKLVEAIEAARRHGVQLVLAQVGFEAFDERSLAAYHKGISAPENRRAARRLSALEHEHGDAFVGTAGHGLIPLHPWTRPEDLRENLAACSADAPWLLPSMTPGARLELYNEWTPLFWKAADEGLIVPAPDRFGWDWRFADPGTGEVVAAAGALLAAMPRTDGRSGAAALGAALAAFEAGGDRRSGYLRAREKARAGRLSWPPSG